MGNGPKQNRLGREVLGIILLGIAFFLGIALYSYNPSDPSLNVQYIGKEQSVQFIVMNQDRVPDIAF